MNVSYKTLILSSSRALDLAESSKHFGGGDYVKAVRTAVLEHRLAGDAVFEILRGVELVKPSIAGEFFTALRCHVHAVSNSRLACPQFFDGDYESISKLMHAGKVPAGDFHRSSATETFLFESLGTGDFVDSSRMALFASVYAYHRSQEWLIDLEEVRGWLLECFWDTVAGVELAIRGGAFVTALSDLGELENEGIELQCDSIHPLKVYCRAMRDLAGYSGAAGWGILS